MLKSAAEAHQAMAMRPRSPGNAAVPDAVTVTRKAREDWPASLTIMKRVHTPEEPNMTADEFSTLLKQAVENLEAGRIDQAEALLTKADRLIDRSTTIHHHHYANGNGSSADDADDEDDDWDDENGGGYAKAKSSNNFKSPSDPHNDEPDDDDEDDNGNNRKVAKWSHDYNLPHMGGTKSPAQPTSTLTGPSQRADTYQLSVTPTVGQPARTSFDEHVDAIVERDGISRMLALSRARIEQAAAYRAFQQFSSEEPTSAQAMRRDRGITTKAAPPTWEDHIATELAKGAPNEEVAGQRVLQQHGSSALRHRMIQKRGPSVSRTFAKAATEIMYADGVDRCEALRRLRKERPDWYDALNAS
jgi:hypothetical protein